MKLHSDVCALACLLSLAAFAVGSSLAAVTPSMTPYEREFVSLDGATRRERFLDADWRKRVCLEESDARKSQGCGRAAADELPRVVRVPNVPNFRDIGGWRGLGGRRIREGMVYRSGGLNDNSHVYYKPEEVIAFYRDGTLESRFGEEGRKVKAKIEGDGGADKINPKASYLRRALIKERCPGKSRLTPEGLAFLVDGLGIKTDLDLRRDREVWGMEGSPAGPTVRWVNISFCYYSQITKPEGKETFAKCFRLFLDKGNYPFVVHCIGGADRTGTLCHVLKALLGVSDDDLAKDWEFTCFSYDGQDFGHKRYDSLVAAMAAYPGATTCEKSEAYVRDCGFTDEDIKRFRDLMLED